MDFAEKIRELSARVLELKPLISTEEATKTSLVLPFLQTLGYDTFDPRVVIPEYTSDTGTKKGEKVDYAVQREGIPTFLIECKACGSCLDAGKANQLHRYFQNTPTARIAILTDGAVYQFFSDLDRPNMMDSRPFMVFDFTNIEDALIPEIKKLANDRFDVETTLSAAQNLKYTRQIKNLVAQEFQVPSDALVRIFASQVYTGPLRANVLDDFRAKVQTAIQHHINDVINERLQGAMSANQYSPADQLQENQEQEAEETNTKPGVVTTEEEVEGFFIIKSILREVIAPERIFMRDTKSYCGVLLDDNNRKPLCRMHFNSSQKYVGTFDAKKNETRHPIETLDEIYALSEELRLTAGFYSEEN